MRQLFLLLLLVAIGIWAYFRFFAGPPAHTGPETGTHFAKQGTFFVLQYVSVPAPHGVIGFEPGREVHFVRADQDKGLLVVTDGEYEVEMKPSQLTNDLDIAALARNGDESSQRQINAYIEREKAIYRARLKAANLKYAKDLEEDSKRLRAGLPPTNGLDNNPYSYLSPPH